MNPCSAMGERVEDCCTSCVCRLCGLECDGQGEGSYRQWDTLPSSVPATDSQKRTSSQVCCACMCSYRTFCIVSMLMYVNYMQLRPYQHIVSFQVVINVCMYVLIYDACRISEPVKTAVVLAKSELEQFSLVPKEEEVEGQPAQPAKKKSMKKYTSENMVSRANTAGEAMGESHKPLPWEEKEEGEVKDRLQAAASWMDKELRKVLV